MDLLAPVGQVYQAGTYSGNPVSVAAGLKTLECLEGSPKLYEQIAAKTKHLVSLMRNAAKTLGIPVVINSLSSVFQFSLVRKM